MDVLRLKTDGHVIGTIEIRVKVLIHSSLALLEASRKSRFMTRLKYN